MELDEVYPLSQHEAASPLDVETIIYVEKQVQRYIEAAHYNKIVLLLDIQNWGNKIASACKRVCEEKKVQLKVVRSSKPWSKSALNDLINLVQQAMSEKT